MKMMSWSRYHCLSRSLMRAERQQRLARIHRIRRQALIRIGVPPQLAPSISTPTAAIPTPADLSAADPSASDPSASEPIVSYW
jgi:hypothetical protein